MFMVFCTTFLINPLSKESSLARLSVSSCSDDRPISESDIHT